MKYLISLFSIAALSIAAHAQTPGVYTLMSGGTNFVAAGTTNGAVGTFNVSEYASVDIQITMKASNTNVTPVIFNFVKSLDGTTYETTTSLTASLTPNGTNEVSKVYNLSVPNVALLKLVSIENATLAASSSYVTNVAVKWRVKPTKTTGR